MEAINHTYLFHNEPDILYVAGLQELIEEEPNCWIRTVRIPLEKKTLEKIETQIDKIDRFINKKYFSSYKNQMLYWLGFGEIGMTCKLKYDLQIVLNDLKNPFRPKDFDAAASKLKFMNSYRNKYRNNYRRYPMTPFKPEKTSTNC